MEAILLSNLNNLGDVICSTAALDLIRKALPDARIGFLIRPDAEPVVRGNPLVDDLFVYSYKSGSGVSSIVDMARQVRRKRYGTYISLDRKPRSALVALLAGIHRRVIPNRLHLTTEPRWWMSFLGSEVLEFPKNSFRCLVEQFSEPVRVALGITGEGHTSLPPLTDSEQARADAVFAGTVGKQRVGYSVRANAKMKNWPAERFAAVMDRLEESRAPFQYVTGAPGDRQYIDSLIGRCRRARPANLAGEATLMETAALAGKSDLFITLDTGAVHVAGNSGIKNLICLFTCTIPEGVLRSAPQARVFFTDAPCCPCLGCHYEYGAAPCQTGISVDEVTAAALDLLDNGKQA